MRALEPEDAKKRAEALRYRLEARSAGVARAAKSAEDRSVMLAIDALRADLRAVEVGDDEWVDQKALAALNALEPRMAELEDAVDVEPYGAQPLPKWVRYLFITGPVLAVVLVLIVVIARRRKKAEIDAAALAKLDSRGSGT